MSAVVIAGDTSGTITLQAPAVAGSTTINLPTVSGGLFTQGNIVGTVSQSSGVPTGAVIERGSNANGEYVKYADGTMICTMERTENRSAPGIRTTSITLPATYVAVNSYVLIANARTTVPDVVSAIGFVRNDASSATMYINRTTTTSTGASIIAIGLWF